MLVAIPGAPNACAASSTIGRPKRAQLLDRRRPAEEVHGHDRLRPRGDPPLDVGRVEVQRRRVDVGEDGRRAAAGDRLGGREERERRADHLVARADPERVEHEHERVGAVRDADRLLDAEVLGRLALEALDLGAEDEAAALERRARTPSFSSGMSGAYCALTSTCGIGARRAMVVERRRRTIRIATTSDDPDRDHDLDVAEVVVRRAPARAERPADAGEARSTRSRCRSRSGPCSGGTAPRTRRPGSRRTSARPASGEPTSTAQSSQRSNQRSARSSRAWLEVEPAAVALEERPAAVERRSPSRRSRRAGSRACRRATTAR